MIEYHLKIQFFTTLSMWQGSPPLLFEFFLFFKNKLKYGTTLPHRQDGEKLYLWVVFDHYSFKTRNETSRTTLVDYDFIPSSATPVPSFILSLPSE